MPNGEGTLYRAVAPPTDGDPNYTYPSMVMHQGNWVDGLGNGTISESWITKEGETYIWVFDVKNGYAENRGEVATTDGNDTLKIDTVDLIAGVPPWANVETDSSIPAPKGVI
jgi:hypothetical protein